MHENILQSLDLKEKESLQEGLKLLIEQSYVIENEYKNLQSSYTSLRQMMSEIIEILPSALWVLNDDKSIFLQNEQALKNANLLAQIDTNKAHYELEFEGRFYVVKNILHEGKLIIQATDISDEKRNERLASMGSVAAHLAHEIRNPIGSISLLTSTLFSKVELKNKHIVLEIQKAIARVERIVTSTLLFTKGVQINRQNFDFYELKDECEQIVQSYNFHANISFEFDFLHCQINADKALIALVFQNLIYNGIDAIEEQSEEGALKISMQNDGKALLVRVFDTGKAIQDENLLFEAFKTTKLKGNGLGLSLCKQIIKAHKGELSFSKEPKNFYFTLPLQ